MMHAACEMPCPYYALPLGKDGKWTHLRPEGIKIQGHGQVKALLDIIIKTSIEIASPRHGGVCSSLVGKQSG